MKRPRFFQSLWSRLAATIALLCVLTIAMLYGSMWLYYDRWYARQVTLLPAAAQAELRELQKSPERNERRIAEIEAAMRWPSTGDDLAMLGLLTALVMPLMVVAAIASARRIARPITDVARAAVDVAQGHFGIRVAAPRGVSAEVQQLVDDFNRMVAQMERYERELKEGSAAIVHELRTPLAAMRGRVQAMLDGVFDAEPRQLRMVLEQTDQLTHLVNDLRDLTLAYAGQLALEPEPLALHALIEERVAWFAPPLRAAAMEVHNAAETGLRVQADRQRLGQVLGILIDNALRYAAAGHALAFETEADAQWVTLRVLDRGPGIAPEHVQNVFERFWRAESSRSRDTGGSGLGLSIAARLCEAHGGSMLAANRPGGGAEFRVRLPRAA